MQTIDKTIAVCGRGLIADAAATALQDFAAIKRVTAEMLPAPGAWDGLVVASDCWDLGTHSAAHQACQARRVPWMPVHTELSTVVIGPLTRPARPGCPACFGLRREHSSAANQVRSDIQRANAAALAADPSALLTRLAASLIGTLAAAEFTADGGGGLPCSVLLVRLGDLSIERHGFLPEPMCPECGGLPDDAPQDARITLSPRPKQALTRYRLTLDRLVAMEQSQAPPPASRTIAVAAAGKSTRAAAMVAEQLAAQLARAGSVFRVDADVVARHLGPAAAQRRPGDPGRAELTGWLHAVERDHEHVIYQPDAEDTAWSRLCLSQSDVVLLAASVGDDPSVGAVEARALATGSLRCELALLHPARPSATARWLKGRPVADHHHLRAGWPGDVARLARMITGTGCGLVLGGGGARGLAHLGVIRALEEAGVPIDVVGGTSIGAIMAALCAQGLDHAERVRRLRDIVRDGRRAFTPTLPLVAWSSGRRADRLLAEHLGPAPIEDLPLRFFCISANLTRAEEVIHERGPLWPGVRASLSLPGIFPPVYAAGDLLIDGGALNNVPVGVMRGRIGNGCIVAVDVSPEVEPLTVPPFEAGMSGWRVLGRRLNPFASPHPVPSVVDILSRSTGLSQVRHRRAALDDHRIDLLLRPPVAGVGTLNFKGGVALIKAGYRHAGEALAKSGLAERFVT